MRLIDADEFIKEMNDLYSRAEWDKRDIHFSLRDVEMNIYMQPTINAEPVRHGKWTESDLDKDFVTCSECKLKGKKGRMAYRPDYAKDLHYCPKCGAKMDMEE